MIKFSQGLHKNQDVLDLGSIRCFDQISGRDLNRKHVVHRRSIMLQNARLGFSEALTLFYFIY
jgi:hypothetical protein